MSVIAPSDLVLVVAGPHQINLSWTNGQVYQAVEIERSPSGGGTLGWNATSWNDDSCQDGTTYQYRVRGWSTAEPPGEFSDWTGWVSATTTIPLPTDLQATAASNTEVTVSWADNSQNESGFRVYRNGALVHTTGPNGTSWQDTGLTPATWYEYQVEAYNGVVSSGLTADVDVFTSDPPNAPALLTATATGTTKIRLNWTDNAENETGFKIEQSADGITYAQVGTVAANIITYEATGLASNTPYWFRVRAYNDSGNSGYCSPAMTSTWAAIAQPTNLTVTPWGAEQLEIIFDDNSELETDHRLERSSDGVTGWTEIATLEPNRTFYRVTVSGNGVTRYFRVRARQSGSPDSYSSYSDVASGTTLSAPTAPSALVLSEIQNTSMRVTWAPGATDEAGFIIETSPDNATWTERGRAWKGLDNFFLRNLTASTLYYVRVCAYNAVGSSAYATSVSGTTLAAYSPSAFERVSRRLNGTLRYYVEVQPAMKLQGWALTSGKTYTYEIGNFEKRIAFDGVEENGTALTLKTSIATVEAAAGSWWYDTATRKMYVHASGGDDPVNYSYVGTFWAYFSGWNKAGDIAEFNSRQYLPLIADGGIPDVSMSIAPIWQGSFSLSSGTIKLINGYRKGWGGYFFDTRAETWLWENRPARILAGAPGATYAQLEIVHTATIQSATWSSRAFELALGDIRAGRAVTLPAETYSATEFANMDSNLADQARPFWYGVNTGVIPKCIDTVNRIYEFHNGRLKSVDAVRQNGVALVAGTDYFIDYQRGRVTLARGLTYSSSDVIDGDITGHVDDADNSLDHGALQFIDFQIRHVGLTVDELDFDSIYTTHDALTAHLGWGAYKGGQDSQELIRLIEASTFAYSIQDSRGRVGLKRKMAAAPSGAIYIRNGHGKDITSSRNLSLYASEFVVNYAENSGESGRFQNIKKTLPAAARERRVQTSITHNTALISESDALALGDEIVAAFGKRPVEITIPSIAWKLMPGDAFYLTADRYPSANGSASGLLMCGLAVTKSPGGRSMTITAEAV
jgi:hypothetical protein